MGRCDCDIIWFHSRSIASQVPTPNVCQCPIRVQHGDIDADIGFERPEGTEVRVMSDVSVKILVSEVTDL